MPGENTIQAQFEREDSARHSILETARLCAALTLPHVLPPDDQDSDSLLPENFQSVGSRGVMNIVGKMVIALRPPGQPFHQSKPAAAIMADPNVPDETKQSLIQQLYERDLQVAASLERSHMDADDMRNPSGFRTQTRRSVTQLIVTGDTLEYLNDDLQLTVYRRDQYVTRRDSSGNVLCNIIKVIIDPLSLTEQQIEQAGLSTDELSDQPYEERKLPLFTRVEWQPASKHWKIEQEVNEQVINTTTEKITPYFNTAYELAPGEHYGRGLVEMNLGDLRSLDEMEERRLDFAAMASMFLTAIDEGSVVREQDMEQKAGSFFRARVRSGEVDDVAIFKANQLADFRVVHDSIEAKTMALSKAMLIESEIQPTGERVTAFQVSRVSQELQGALGGPYASIADEQQRPLINRAIHVLEKKQKLQPLPEGTVEVEILTGVAALSRSEEGARVLNFITALAQLGDEGLRRVNFDVLIRTLQRNAGVFEPGLIKSLEQMKEEQQMAMEAQAQSQAIEQTIQSTGKIAEQQAAGAT